MYLPLVNVFCLSIALIFPSPKVSRKTLSSISKLSSSISEINLRFSVFNGFLNSARRRAEFKKPLKTENLKLISEIEDDSFEIEDKVFLETLGEGKIKAIDRQKTLTKGKYNLILDVEFEIGQFCRFAKLLSIEKENKTDLFTENIENEVNLLNGLNLDYKSKERIEKFMESLNETNKKEFKEIIKLIEKRAKR